MTYPKDALRDHLVAMHSGCESPIESMLASSILYAIGLDMWERSQSDSPVLPMVELDTQVKISGYRVDIAVTGSDGGAKIAIECDGHEFHEKTKQQAARDKSRDREIAAAGWRVIRFTGAEIFRDPFACAAQVMEIANQMEGKAAEIAYRATFDKGAAG